jgi:uncharacterized protein
MDAPLTEFVEVLRQNGLKVGLSETVDAALALTLIDFDDKETVRACLKTTLCKRAADASLFDRAFDLYFSGIVRAFEGIDKSLARRIEEAGLLQGDELKMIVFMLKDLGGQMSALGGAMLQGDRGSLAKIFRAASLQLDLSHIQNSLQSGFFSRRLLAQAGIEGLRSDLASLEAEMKARGVSGQAAELVSKHVGEAMRQVEAAARAEMQRQIDARLRKASTGFEEKNFQTLSRAEMDIAKRAVTALAQKLKARLVRRQRSKRHGSLHPLKTLRANLVSGGVPMVPHFRRRRPQRPDVVVLCDISDSVRNASRVLLLFTHTLQSLFSRVRSFVFVSELAEVTKHFQTLSVEDAIDAVVSGEVVSVSSNSNYGHALALFARHHLGIVSRRTTVLVLGDGRNNHNEANVWALEEMKRKAKRAVWLCTEPATNWGFGDSEMHNYARAASQVVTVQNLNDLTRIATRLVT